MKIDKAKLIRGGVGLMIWGIIVGAFGTHYHGYNLMPETISELATDLSAVIIMTAGVSILICAGAIKNG